MPIRHMLCAAACLAGLMHAQTASIPTAYQDLYTQLNGELQTFASTVNSSWNHISYPVAFSAQLTSASAEQGPALLGTNYYIGVLQQVDSLKALGVKAITVHIDFPILDPAFYQNPADFQNYLNFYKQLATDIRARGLKLIVESTLVFPLDGIGSWDLSGYYATLSEAQYMAGRAANILTIAQQLKPDYLSVLTEPDTEATESGFGDLGTTGGATNLLNTILTTLTQNGVQGIPIGAGCGTWLSNYQQFIQSFAAYPVQYIDMHVYPSGNNYLMNALSYADTAASYGKPVAISEAWEYKERDSEYGTLSTGDLAARNVWSFWQPIDTEFLQAMVNFAQYKRLLFFAPYWSPYFQAYVDYNSTVGMTDLQMMNLAQSAEVAAQTAGQYNATGLSYAAAIISPPDTTPPGAPGSLAGQASTSQVGLTWTASTDNIGVAGYRIYKNGTLVATTAFTYYQDLGLPSNMTNTYGVAAYDAAGNASPVVTVTVTTLSPPDTTPPSYPVGLTGVAVAWNQINLTWVASTDNVGVAGYQIFRGSSATSLAPLGGSTTPGYTDTLVAPSTTYYYAVAAYDAAGNFSSKSAVVMVTSLADTTPPTVPQHLTAQAVSMTQVNLAWAASTDNFMLAGYKVYRGTSPSALTLLAVITSTSYSDTLAAPKTTYYYTVAAVDVAGNLSAQSPAVTVTTPADLVPPSTPAGLQATSTSLTQVSLAWSASTDNYKVVGYRIYRGASASSLTLIGSSTTTSFTSASLQAGTTYYFAVAAVDLSGNLSPQSPAVAVQTLPDTVAPSVPAGLTATVASGSKVSLTWTPSTDNVKVAGYKVYRGTSATSLTLLAGSATTANTDTRTVSKKTYYYAVCAYDPSGNTSALSATISVTMP
ncbi:MAG TPA: fibronectin type III domain-containing protein [Bryobacteraceae bacterium]|nr:fibronectin type III domain-containing protein [Bryobacteraceae bacterium]